MTTRTVRHNHSVESGISVGRAAGSRIWRIPTQRWVPLRFHCTQPRCRRRPASLSLVSISPIPPSSDPQRSLTSPPPRGRSVPTSSLCPTGWAISRGRLRFQWRAAVSGSAGPADARVARRGRDPVEAAPAALLYACYVFWCHRGVRERFGFLTASTVFAGLLLAHSYVAFEHPFTTNYAIRTDAYRQKDLLFGISDGSRSLLRAGHAPLWELDRRLASRPTVSHSRATVRVPVRACWLWTVPHLGPRPCDAFADDHGGGHGGPGDGPGVELRSPSAWSRSGSV